MLITDDDSNFLFFPSSPSYVFGQNQDRRRRVPDWVAPFLRPSALALDSDPLITVTLCDGARRREGEANMFLLAANHAALRWISPQRHRGKLRHGCPGFRGAVALPSVSGAAAAVDNDERQPTNHPASERVRGRNEHLPRASEEVRKGILPPKTGYT